MWRILDTVQKELANFDKENVQIRDLSQAFVMGSMQNSCKPAVRTIRCPMETWNKLQAMFVVVSEAKVDTKLTRTQNIQLAKHEKISK